MQNCPTTLKVTVQTPFARNKQKGPPEAAVATHAYEKTQKPFIPTLGSEKFSGAEWNAMTVIRTY